MSKTISGYHTTGITPTKFGFRQQPEPRILKISQLKPLSADDL
jgi:hypothetical protein